MTACHPERGEGSGSASEPSQIPRRCAPRNDGGYAPRNDGERSRQVCALVTGGGGFLGRAIVERLLARGDRVRSFSRGDYPELGQLGVEVVRGDLADADAVDDACRGCDVVFHAGARVGVWGTYRDHYASNVRGTENIIAACRAHGVSRLVYTSSPSVVFTGGDLENVDESVPYPAHYRMHYSATKALAERTVLAASDDNLRTLALRPHLIWGPRDSHIVPRLIARARAGRLFKIGPGTKMVDSIYVDNAADAHVLGADALEVNPNAAGRAYFISNGEPLPLWELINRIVAAAGLPPATRRVTRRGAYTVAWLIELVHAVFGIESEPRLTRFVVEQLTASHWFNISAARKELGYEPRVSIDEGLRRLEQWFRETGGYQT